MNVLFSEEDGEGAGEDRVGAGHPPAEMGLHRSGTQK